MTSRQKSSQRGFTFFEALVVMGIFAIVGGVALFVSMDTYRASSFSSDRNTLVAALQHARAQAMNNMCFGTCVDGKPHGVHIQSDSYVIFQGDAYHADDPQNAAFDSRTSIIKHPATLDIVFSQLSGTTTPTSITLTEGGRSSVITIGSEGRISWTH